MPAPKRPGPAPRDDSGAARTRTIRTTDAEHQDQIAAAEHAGLPHRTWARQALAEAAARELEAARPRFGTLEEVLGYVAGLPGDERWVLLSRLIPITEGRCSWIDGALATAWMAGHNAEIRAACERFTKGER